MTDHSTAVIIAAYDAEASLDQAVRSALAQAETAQVCIVDDASTDRTAAIANAWASRDSRVLALSNQGNLGPAASRNRAIAATSAPWITILDADDYMLDGRLTRLFANDVGADFIADALMRTAVRNGVVALASPAPASPLTLQAFLLGNLGAEKGPLDLGFLKPVFRRAFLEQHGLCYDERLRLGEDFDFYARALALDAHFTLGGAAGYVSVERPGSLSKSHTEADLERLRHCSAALAGLRPFSQSERRAFARHLRSVDCRLQWRRLISAVKARDLLAAAATFRSPQVTLYLLSRLGEQALLRAGRLINARQGLVPS